MAEEFEPISEESQRSIASRNGWAQIAFVNKGPGWKRIGTSLVTIESEDNKLQMIVDIQPEPACDSPVLLRPQLYKQGHWVDQGEPIGPIRGYRLLFGSVGRVLVKNTETGDEDISLFQATWNVRP